MAVNDPSRREHRQQESGFGTRVNTLLLAAAAIVVLFAATYFYVSSQPTSLGEVHPGQSEPYPNPVPPPKSPNAP